MSHHDLSISITSSNLYPNEGKQKIVTNNFKMRKSLVEENNQKVKLPSVFSKSHDFPPIVENVRLKRYNSQRTTNFVRSIAKNGQLTPNIASTTRLPSINEHEQRETFDNQRKQIYALNRFMRKLEQEQFQQFCKLNNLPYDDALDAPLINEDTNLSSST